jgi:hypothetical protein
MAARLIQATERINVVARRMTPVTDPLSGLAPLPRVRPWRTQARATAQLDFPKGVSQPKRVGSAVRLR